MKRYVLGAIVLIGCAEPMYDHGTICAVAGADSVEVTAYVSCGSDHEGATLECTATETGSTVLVETVFKDGKDPNDGCAPALTASCGAAVEPGEITVAFAGEEWPLTVPDGGTICVPGGATVAPGDSGSYAY